MPPNLYDYEVTDLDGNRIGTIDAIWVDETTGAPEFAAVKTGWIFGRDHVVPIRGAAIDDAAEVIRVPYDESRVRGAPDFPVDHDLSPEEEARIYTYYGLPREPTGFQEAGMTGGVARETNLPETELREGVEIPLREEHLRAGKREVETGGVRLRKVVRTETESAPVELRREEIEIERLPPGEVTGTGRGELSRPFEEGEIVLRERAEEPVVEKTTEVVGGVRATPETRIEREEVEGKVRREEVDIEREGEERRF